MADTTASQLIVDVRGRGIASTSASMGKLDKATIAAAGAVGLLAAGFVAVGRSAIKGAADLEQNQIALTTMLKSADKANKLLSDIRKMGAETPFETKDLINAGSQLVAFGVQAEDVVKKMTMIGDIAAGTGTPIKELAVLYGKARIAGTLYAEDLNMLMERKINIFGELEKITGKSTQAIKKMASNGKLSFQLLEKAFANMTNKGGLFANLMAKQSKSLSGLWSTFKSLMEESATSLGTFFLPQLKAVTTYLVEVAAGIYQWFQNSDNLNAVLETTATILKSVAIATGIVAARYLVVFAIQKSMIAMGWIKYLWMMRAAIAKNITMTNLWAGAQWLINAAMTANPIGLVIVAIAGLSTAIFFLVKHWETVKFTFKNVMLEIQIGLKNMEAKFRASVIKMAWPLAQLLQEMGKPSLTLKAIILSNVDALNKNIAGINKLKKEQTKLQSEYGKNLKKIQDKSKKEQDAIKKTGAVTRGEANKTKSVLEKINTEVQKWGGMALNAFNAIGSAVAAADKAQITALDNKMQKELEAAGVAEQTTKEQAKKEYDAAVATGNVLDIEEKRRALVKATIEEKYQKKKAKMEYESAVNAWNFQMAAAAASGAMAILNAVASGFRDGGIYGAIAYGAFATATAGAQIAAVAASKPAAPTAQMGGSFIVPPGNPGDSASLNVNQGEKVNVEKVANSGDSKNEKMTLMIDGKQFEAYMIDSMNKIANSGKFNITRKGVVKTA